MRGAVAFAICICGNLLSKMKLIMEGSTSNIEQIAEEIRLSFLAKDAARERALRLCREVIRHSADAIRALHREEYRETEILLGAARASLDEINECLTEYTELLHSGFVHNAQKEYAEGSITLALIEGKPLPTPEELGVTHPAYLNGMGEAMGELRRHLLDTIRKGDLSRGEELLAAMDDIYGVLVTMDFPDALTYGLRRTTDMVRGVLEKTRGDLTLSLRQQELERRLDTFHAPP
jgi:translin